jgi:tetratricopeptide (TPR) repeat protein
MQIFAARYDKERALAELDEAVRLAPSDPYFHVYRGALLEKMGRHEDAEKAFAASISLKPTITAYLTRAANRPKSDLAGRLADVAAAEKLEPASADVPMTRARAYADAGRFADALQALDRAAKANASSESLGATRAWVYAKAGRADAALKEFAALRTQAAGRPGALNALCWTQATLGIALNAALNDCQAALSVSPKTAAYLDSEGFVYLRLGRFKESVEAYDAAIEQRPLQAESLYGRGIAKLRMGKMADGEADIAAAQKMSDRIEEEFKGYGVTR